jgi:hypothetical protein
VKVSPHFKNIELYIPIIVSLVVHASTSNIETINGMDGRSSILPCVVSLLIASSPHLVDAHSA